MSVKRIEPEQAKELLEDGVNGLLFRLGDVEHLAERTLEVATDPSLRAAIGSRARQDVLPRSIDKATAMYTKELEAVLELSSARR